MNSKRNIKKNVESFLWFTLLALFAAVIGIVAYVLLDFMHVAIRILLIALVEIMVSIGISYIVNSAVNKPLKKIAEITEKIASGEHVADIDLNKTGDISIITEGLKKISDRIDWYEGIIDAVPFPVHVIDNDMNWTYLNKAFEKLMVDQGVAKDRKDACGKPCSSAGANICNTQNCGIKQLLKGNPESYFDWCGMNCKQDTSFLRNKKGEKIGYVEVVTDLTSILKVNAYNKAEVERVATNLDLLSEGILDMNLEVKEADQYTKEAKENFVKINNNLIKVKNAINLMTEDAEMLSDAAIEGKLNTRADASKHNGEYRKVVEGVNKTLDSVIVPINEAIEVVAKFAVNDYTTSVSGNYKGMLGDFAEAINTVRTRLLSVQDAVMRISKGDTTRLEEFNKVGKRSENDMIMPSCIAAMQAIRDLINDAALLANAAVKGDLSVRSKIDGLEGGYKDIIEGMNKTLDAIVKPIKEASDVMQEMAEGNLTVNMDGSYEGDYAKIKEALNFTIKSFNEVLNNINTSTAQVASGARQVSDSAQALSQGSTEQASSIEQLTASMEEIASQTKNNASNANQANELALAAKGGAVKGNNQMKEMLKAMDDINEASANISKIIKVIDEIAFQTNILALNAAVEAARAGQHGKGFAVVAEEVRNLAARSANAAKETTVLIEGTIKKVEGGTKIANETADALNRIVEDVAKAANIVGDIALASNEQATGIAQVNQGILQVSEVTQTNSATSEESAAASEELSSQAEILKDMVSKFKLKRSAAHSYSEISDLNPDIIKMLQNISDNKKDTANIEAKNEISAKKPRIVLNDGEFGKY